MSSALLYDAAMVFLGMVVEALPFVLLGVFLSSFLQVYVGSEKLLRWLPQGIAGRLLAGPMLGFAFPVCECGNIPLARRLLQKGVPVSTVTAFLFSAPVFNPVVVLVTWTAFRGQPHIVGWRLAFSLLTAFLVSIFAALVSEKHLLQPALLQSRHPAGCGCDEEKIEGPRFRAFLDTAGKEFVEMCAVLAFGALIASLAQAALSRQAVVQFGQGPITSVLAMMGLAMIVSICSNVDAFFALGYASIFSPGALLAFLVLGPLIDLKSFALLGKIYTPRAILFLSVLILQTVFLLTVFYNLNVS